uniref:acyl carrier protein n=1 Tax=Hypnea cornuta TaxID=105603 RepID=UPI0027DAA200|nr:acyl carrier protein [Hypnea cornuta]WCH55753.1 acyl carrier protein [Hypnea cornuta]
MSNKEQEIFVELKKIVIQELSVKPDQVKLESKFVDDFGADSLDMVELVLAIEEGFEIEVPDKEVAKIHNVGEAVELIYNIYNESKSSD